MNHITETIIPSFSLAYLQVTGSENLPAAFGHIISLCTPLQLIHSQSKMITIFHHSFRDTPADKVEMSAGIIVPNSTLSIPQMNLSTIDTAKYLVGHYEIGMTEFELKWKELFHYLNTHGYQKATQDPFEIYYNNYNDHPQKKCIVDMCIPLN